MQDLNEFAPVRVWPVSTIYFCASVGSLLLGAYPVAILCLLLGVLIRLYAFLSRSKSTE